MDMFNEMNFTPSADGTLDNMKYGGIDVSEIVQELKDNCDDAASTKTDIYMLPKDSMDKKLAEFLIHDTGRGMIPENLLNAMVLAYRHEHSESHIGKFGVGLKNATIGLGDQITIVTKTSVTQAVGVFLNIPDMRRQGTFKPTQYEVDASALRGQFPSEIWQAFCASSSGTLISVKGIHEHHVHDVQELAKNVHRSLNFNYSDSISSVTTIRTSVSASDQDLVVKHVDAFYRNSPENLAYCHETELRVYPNGKVFEVLTQKRRRGRKDVNGSVTKPLYFQCNTLPKNALTTSDMFHQPVPALPDGEYKVINTRFIQVSPEAYEREGKTGDWDGFDSRRRGFFFRRGKRMVGTCMSLEIPMNDSNNHLRMEVIFGPGLDLEMGVRTQKQMSKGLHSVAISDALRIVWKQLANARIKERSDEIQKNKVRVDLDDETDESSDATDASRHDGIAEFLARARRDKEAFDAAKRKAQAEAEAEVEVEVEVEVEQEAEVEVEQEQEQESEQEAEEFGSFHEAPKSDEAPAEKTYESSNGYLRLMEGTTVLSRVPNVNCKGLEQWISTVPLPAGKTRHDLFKTIAAFWGLE